MDWNKLILDHVTVPKPPVTEVGWRVRNCPASSLWPHKIVTLFEITTDDGDTWINTHFWHKPPTAGDIVRADYAVGAQHPGARLVEYEEINGTWIPRIEQEEEE